jgi:hypothetical protein
MHTPAQEYPAVGCVGAAVAIDTTGILSAVLRSISE